MFTLTGFFYLIMYTPPKIKRFNEHVLSRYQIYNSIFITLPYDDIVQTGTLLPLFSDLCEKGFANQQKPNEIVASFFTKYTDKSISEEDKISMLFRFIQYIERQVVLFDAIEDASFAIVNNMEGRGSLRNLKEEAQANNALPKLKKVLNDFSIKIVLTAHPTQFYPGTVLGIITDLAKAVQESNLTQIKRLLAQLGKTPFFKKQKPTPFDEAVSLIWYLEHVFYTTISQVVNYIQENITQTDSFKNAPVTLGFWPGGDRDGNPFVTAQITRDVANKLHKAIMRCYHKDLKLLKRRITFKKVHDKITRLEQQVYAMAYTDSTNNSLTVNEFLGEIESIKSTVKKEHQSLFVEELTDLINKINLFGFFFAGLDIRQDSRKHSQAISDLLALYKETNNNSIPPDFLKLSEQDKISVLENVTDSLNENKLPENELKRAIASIYALKDIQKQNGEAGCNRYIISNCGSVLDVMQVYTLLRCCNWTTPKVDIVPLFETVTDLQQAHVVMKNLYTNKTYKKHLQTRNNKQYIMLGFSDGTKDGGYLMANWSIYQAKEALTKVARDNNIEVVFFDGRGGPPARGGGKTHQFYASLGPTIENKQLQLTIQGQTISSNFGTVNSCKFNIEQLLSSGLTSCLYSNEINRLTEKDREVLNSLANISYQAYTDFKNHPKFLSYLENRSTLKYYAKANIGSRPSKRGTSDKLIFSDLRAIPFVGSWSQLKQNVPGFYGLGTAIEHFEKQGKLKEVKQLYQRSLFFRTLVQNSMMSLTKSFFELTAYMKEDKEYGAFWQLIYNEHLKTKRLLLTVSGYKELMEDAKAMKASIAVREKIVLPLLTIQQHALLTIQELNKNKKQNAKLIRVYEKMVTRSLFGNINASRNSA